MTRSKAIVIWSAIEGILLLAFILLCLSNAIDLTVFIICLIGLGVVSAFNILHVLRSFRLDDDTQV